MPKRSRCSGDLVEQRKRGEIPDQLLFVEHPHVITLGRNGQMENLLASEEILQRAGIEFHETDRGGDITYHGPGQIVGYPIFDLREWKRDVVAYVRAMEQAIIDALAEFGIRRRARRKRPACGSDGAKICAIGVHISRWVTSHGFALNVTTDLRYFQYIVPCGLTKPVTSMRALGCDAVARAMCKARWSASSRQAISIYEVLRSTATGASNGKGPHDRRRNAPDGRKHRGRNADQVAEKAWRARGARRAAVRDLDRQGRHRNSGARRGRAAGVLVEEGKTVGINTVVARSMKAERAAAAAARRSGRRSAGNRRPRPHRRLRPAPAPLGSATSCSGAASRLQHRKPPEEPARPAVAARAQDGARVQHRSQAGERHRRRRPHHQERCGSVHERAGRKDCRASSAPASAGSRSAAGSAAAPAPAQRRRRRCLAPNRPRLASSR